jgi:hypothetical protein
LPAQQRLESHDLIEPQVDLLADATCGTIRLKLFKIGAQVRISVRRIKFSMASAFPNTDVDMGRARQRGSLNPWPTGEHPPSLMILRTPMANPL